MSDTTGRKKPPLSLFADMIIESGLNYLEAVALLDKAKRSRSSKHVAYFVTSTPDTNTWILAGRPLGLAKMFVERPDDFVIDR